MDMVVFLIKTWKFQGISRNQVFLFWRDLHISHLPTWHLTYWTTNWEFLPLEPQNHQQESKKKGNEFISPLKLTEEFLMHILLLHLTQLLHCSTLFTWLLCPLTFTVSEIWCRSEFAVVCTCLLKHRSVPHPLRKAWPVTSGLPRPHIAY